MRLRCWRFLSFSPCLSYSRARALSLSIAPHPCARALKQGAAWAPFERHEVLHLGAWQLGAHYQRGPATSGAARRSGAGQRRAPRRSPRPPQSCRQPHSMPGRTRASLGAWRSWSGSSACDHPKCAAVRPARRYTACGGPAGCNPHSIQDSSVLKTREPQQRDQQRHSVIPTHGTAAAALLTCR